MIGLLAVFAIVIALKTTQSGGKRRYRFICLLCIALVAGIFIITMLNWKLEICIACGMILRLHRFFFRKMPITRKEADFRLYLKGIRTGMEHKEIWKWNTGASPAIYAPFRSHGKCVFFVCHNDKHYHSLISQLTSTP